MVENNKVVIALGYFDGVHKGHQMVIEKAKSVAKERGYKVVVFTFGGDLKKITKKNNGGTIYSLEEKTLIINQLGVENIFVAPVSKSFLSKGKLAFLKFLNKNYNVKAYVCGKDYKFGKNGGDVNFLTLYARQNQQEVFVVKDVFLHGEKISSTIIKEHLKKAKLDTASEMLGHNYFILGKVVSDRHKGSNIGFPTANVKLNGQKCLLKKGVYIGKILVGGTYYKAIINYGNRPTFDLDETLLEAHLIDFNGNLYGKTIKIEFLEFIREIKKFSNEEELIARLNLDLKLAKEKVYD